MTAFVEDRGLKVVFYISRDSQDAIVKYVEKNDIRNDSRKLLSVCQACKGIVDNFVEVVAS